MTKYIAFILLACFFSWQSTAQKYDYQWPFGDGHTIANGFGISTLDFNNGQVTVSPFAETDPEMSNAGSFICDENGELMLMTNNCEVYDRNFQVISNGDSLTPGTTFNTFCADYGDYPADQSSLFLPSIDNDSVTYLLHKDSELSDALQDVVSQHFYLSIIIKKQDGTFYLKEKRLLLGTNMVVNRLTACLHQDGVRWWTWVAGYNTNKFYKFLVGGPEIVQGPFVQQIGIPLINQELDIGQTAFSPDAKYLAINNEAHGVMLYRFDNETGIFSDPKTYSYPNMNSAQGLVFSLNSNLIYVSTVNNLYQMDIEDISSTPVITHIDYVWTVDDSGWPVGVGSMYIGPDCRIYVSPATTSNYLHVIHLPNEKGIDCQFEVKAIRSPTRLEFDLPNIPMYRFNGQCDGDIGWGIVVANEPEDIRSDIQVFPNPVADQAIVMLSEGQSVSTLLVLDIFGREVQRIELSEGQIEARISTDDLSPGVYFMVAKGGSSPIKFVVAH